MARTTSKIVLVVQILIVVLPISGFLGFADSLLSPIEPILRPIIFIYENLINFLAVMLPLFIAGAIFAYFAKSRSLLYGHVFLLFLAFAVLVLFVWSHRSYSQF